MENLYTSPFAHAIGLDVPGMGRGGTFLLVAVLAAIWSLIWKGFALWRAARNDQKNWFIALLLVNTLGILEIVYLVFFRADRAGFRNQSPIIPEPEVVRTTIIEEVVVDE